MISWSPTFRAEPSTPARSHAPSRGSAANSRTSPGGGGGSVDPAGSRTRLMATVAGVAGRGGWVRLPSCSVAMLPGSTVVGRAGGSSRWSCGWLAATAAEASGAACATGGAGGCPVGPAATVPARTPDVGQLRGSSVDPARRTAASADGFDQRASTPAGTTTQSPAPSTGFRSGVGTSGRPATAEAARATGSGSLAVTAGLPRSTRTRAGPSRTTSCVMVVRGPRVCRKIQSVQYSDAGSLSVVVETSGTIVADPAARIAAGVAAPPGSGSTVSR